jgi:hypothetical protein
MDRISQRFARVSADNLVSFPSNSSARPVAAICAEFCDRWHGQDVAEGARLLQTVLPARVPGALQIVIARALGELDVPPFATTEEFRAAVRRFAAGAPKLDDISDVRRARRAAHITLSRVAHETNLPVHVLRQLEWGDFRDWHHEEWMRRVCHEYAQAVGLNPARVLTIVEAERARVRAEPRPVYVAPRRGSGRRRHYAAAAAATFIAGLLAGGMIVDRASEFMSGSGPEVADADPFAGETATAVPADGMDDLPGTSGDSGTSDAPPTFSSEAKGESQPSVPQPSAPVASSGTGLARANETTATASPAAPAPMGPINLARVPQLQNAISSDSANFSPAFSNVGTAVFFHRDEGVGSALMKADPDDTTGGFRIVSIVQDGARNYHVKPSPDGSKIAFDSDRDGERGVYIAKADGTGVYRVSGPGFAAVPSWSPDGTRLAFVRGEPSKGSRVWNLWLLDLPSNTSVRLTSHSYGQPWGASWFPDGKRLAYSYEDRLTVLNLETGAKRVFKSPRQGRLVRTPAVSPGGRHVVFQVHRDGAWLLDLKDDSMQRILADPTAEEFSWDRTGRRLAFHSRRSGAWSVWIMSEPSGS